MSDGRNNLSAEQKLRIVLEAVARPGDPLQSFLDREGVSVQDLHEWYRTVEAAALDALNGGATPSEVVLLRRRALELEEELSRTRERLAKTLAQLEGLSERVSA